MRAVGVMAALLLFAALVFAIMSVANLSMQENQAEVDRCEDAGGFAIRDNLPHGKLVRCEGLS